MFSRHLLHSRLQTCILTDAFSLNYPPSAQQLEGQHMASRKSRSTKARTHVRFPLTLFTTGVVSTSTKGGRRFLDIMFAKEQVKFAGKQLTWGEQVELKKLLLPAGTAICTNGAVIESHNKFGTVLEIVSAEEVKSRFPNFPPKRGRREPAKKRPGRAVGAMPNDAPHFCILRGTSPATYYCDDTYCKGACTLHTEPVFYCTCGL
jgi:hypothetical protein